MASEVAHELDEQSWLYRPSFPDEWERIPLLSMARWVNGLAFRDFQFSDTGKPIIKIAEIKGGITGQTKFTNQTFAESVFVKSGDMLFSWSGQPETSIDVFWWRRRDGWLNQHIFKVTPIEELDPVFFFYVLRYLKPNFIGIARNKQTTGLGHVTRRDIENIEAAFPPLAEQKAIAAVLGALDDKIELNLRMNATLEATARALFQSWFVDFDPVRAKLDGCKPVGIEEATANLFPNAFQDSSLGHIPNGWQIRGLDKIADYLNGLALQKYPPGNGPTFPVIKIAQLRKGDVTGADRCNTELPQQYVVEDGDVLFSWSGSLEVELWCGGPGALNQHLFKVTSQEFPKWFYYLWTLHHLDEFRLIAASKATTMGHIQRSHITDAKVVVPPRNLLDSMTLTMSPIIDQLIANRIQSRTLAVLRDTLLPKLLSGELSVENLQS